MQLIAIAVALSLAACGFSRVDGITPLCGDDTDAPPVVAPDAPEPDAPAPTWNPSPVATFPDTTGQGHPTVTLLFPTDYASSPEIARPLVLMLNGWNQLGANAPGRFRMQGFENEGAGALVLAPSGIVGSEGKRRWNASAACCEPVLPANDDVAYLSSLVEAVVAAGWHVDLARVSVLGVSNGAAMAHRLVCDRADLFTAALMISGVGLPTGSSCSQSRPVHRLHAHARGDDIFFYAGDRVATFTTPDMPSPYPPFQTGEVGQAIQGNGCTGAFPTLPTTRTLNLDDHAGYPPMVADTVVGEVAGCPALGTITIWEGPYLAPSWNHSLSTSPELGVYVRDWLASHPGAL